MSWFHKLFGLCEHKWEGLQVVKHTNSVGRYSCTEYRQECKKCSYIKSVKLNKTFLF